MSLGKRFKRLESVPWLSPPSSKHISRHARERIDERMPCGLIPSIKDLQIMADNGSMAIGKSNCKKRRTAVFQQDEKVTRLIVAVRNGTIISKVVTVLP